MTCSISLLFVRKHLHKMNIEISVHSLIHMYALLMCVSKADPSILSEFLSAISSTVYM
jgi:hypothetical protein